MLKTILVGVDGSDTAMHAARVAAELARATGAALHVISAIDESMKVPEPASPDVRVLSPGEVAERIAQQTARELPGAPTIHAVPAVGKPADAFVEVAKEIGADLIVVGNRRVQGVGRLLGSGAGGVANHAPCDVYIVKTT